MSALTQYPPDQPWLLRIEGSGVWLGGRLVGPGALPGTWRVENARRAHRWHGAIDCTDLAQAGPATSSRVTAAATFDFRLDRLLETHPMSGDAIAQLNRVPVAKAEK